MTLTDGSRKRTRACEDEGCEFMPISKRINNLKIRSSGSEECSPVHHHEGASSSSASSPHGSDSSPTENPYCHINRVLYEAHLARQQRMTQSS
uniref:Uncharacterized protein n=1 Tax=Ornithodoros turicata TaxID=34597 RepID=A0A2R5LDE8_9ACAR